ncbi:hypothetical protein AAFF_G00284880 [Aldrovandia affinis]|uniref:Esterase OVCA2 n=1 Tax=Aldrovandia affinis TaxID=143900 RepID=A0AAD7TBT1_9TELE|nr:hypothetical protein AAFF_G00284880 [Aldrovandia affinis]
MSAAVSVPLRILCIHGYRQNSGSFRDKTGALRKLLKKQVEWVYMNAPHSVPQRTDVVQEQKEVAKDEEDPRGWWFSDIQAQSFDARQVCGASLGLEDSLEAVKKAVRELGPFDGILGFSQGAALKDGVIPDSLSRDLLPRFQNPQVLTHPGGHFVPAASVHRQTYQEFLRSFQD